MTIPNMTFKTLFGLFACATLLALPLEASAQYDEPDDRYGPEVIVGGVTALNTERLYLVQENDTLWDLSDEFYFDSMMWPLLWSLNPQVTNPHWIYPGDLLFIQPPGKQDRTLSVVWSASRFNTTPRSLLLKTLSKGFMATEDYLESGQIHFAAESKDMLSTYDEVYVEFTEERVIRVGDEYTIYRIDRPLLSPTTEDEIGKLVKFLGTMKIIETTKPKLVKGIILNAEEEIFRGDLITTIRNLHLVTEPSTNTVEQAAKVIDTFYEVKEVAEHQYVIIDKGSTDGVKPGNRLVIRERGDPYISTLRDDELGEFVADDFPWQDIGSIMILQAYDNHSLAIVTNSIHEIHAGQDLYMYDNY